LSLVPIVLDERVIGVLEVWQEPADAADAHGRNHAQLHLDLR
jgi:hypothetical protein